MPRSMMPNVPDVDSVRRAAGDSEHHRRFLPPLPPPPPFPGFLDRDYHDRWRRHYHDHADLWFGGHIGWRGFIHGCVSAPWFWPAYPRLYVHPWVYGFYDPIVYVRYGWTAPVWCGFVYEPWWDWCDAPFVYYYFRYPARFSFHITLNGTYGDYASNYGDAYSISYSDYVDSSDVLMVADDRPLGLWVPGHYDQTLDGEWVWMPGYYAY